MANTVLNTSGSFIQGSMNMLDIIFWIAIGAFIGWNFPQPFWAVVVQEKIQNLFNKKENKE